MRSKNVLVHCGFSGCQKVQSLRIFPKRWNKMCKMTKKMHKKEQISANPTVDIFLTLRYNQIVK